MRVLDPAALFSATFRMLRRHPVEALALCAAGTLLAALAPAMQLLARLPDRPEVLMLLALVAKIPLEMYAFPRFIARADAETVNHPGNTMEAWQSAFEARWLWAFLAKIGLYMAVAGGIALLVLPGLVVWGVFGWAPLRVLLRGERLSEALGASARIMGRAWPQVVPLAGLFLAFYLSAALGLGLLLALAVPEPSAWQRLTHPLIWAAQAAGTALDLLLTVGFLALHQRVEPVLEEPRDSP